MKMNLKQGPFDPAHLVVLTTHPIQYQAPLFRALAQQPDMRLTVLYASLKGAEPTLDEDFGVEYKWDVPLLEGYRWELMENQARKPAVSTFRGTKVPQLQDYLQRLSPDAVLVPGWGRRYYVQGMMAAFRLGIPLIIRGEARLVSGQPLFKKIVKKTAVAWAMRHAAAVVTIGKRNREFYEWCGVSASRIFESGYFVDNDFFADKAREQSANRRGLRAKWNIPLDATVFLFVGKMIPKKRPLDVLCALDAAKTNGLGTDRKIFCLMAGDGPLRMQCEDYAGQNRISAAFPGFLNQAELVDAYVASDCLVLPSDYRETWGLVVNEAMASGLTAIVSDRVGCAADLIDEGRTGYTFPFRNVHALAEHMISLANDEQRLVRLKRNASRHIANYDLNQATQAIYQAFAYVCFSQKKGKAVTV